MRARLERYANHLWYETPCPPRFWRMLSALHGRVLGSSWQRPDGHPPVPVIVVGNLAVGGSGKTPTVIALARYLTGVGLQTAVISRGYGGDRGAGLGKRPVRVNPESDPGVCGDEPVLIAQQSAVEVWVCRDRRAAMDAAVAAGAGVIVSDDGLQHRRLARSFEIVLIDGRRRFGNGWLLPAGPLRQPLKRLGQVDAVLFRGPDEQIAATEQYFELRPEALVRLDDDARLAPDALAGSAVSAVAGIAHPGQFVRSLEALGQQPTLHAFPDHHAFVAGDLEGIPAPIVTTAKDAVKLRRLKPRPTGIHVLEVSAALPEVLLQTVAAHVQQFRQ